MKTVFLTVISMMILAGCASKEFDQKSYDRQNQAAEKSLDKLEK
jgi:uncharacterized protein YxeA